MRSIRKASVATIKLARSQGYDEQRQEHFVPYGVIQGRVVRDEALETAPNGTQVMTHFSVWIDADEPELPLRGDRLQFETLGEERTTIAVTRDEGVNLRGVLDHVYLRCREE